MRSVKGFTLIELMVALVILGVALTLGSASFSGSLERTRADADANELLHVFSWARLQAINNSSTVTISALTDDNWAQDISVELNGQVIRSLPGFRNGAVVAATGDVDEVAFDALGGLGSPANAVTFTYTLGEQTRTVLLCPTGRAQAGGAC
ncbi:MAG TPA: general secretion pathway protein GspH [Pseudomonas sp.]|nr:general secretion pathway protein GspH [Pseudomonas sp.]|tara:strand:- start:5582 stop:6034 length:453 start_codon:yes stop_codon:yes gene_type:complete